MSQGSSPTAGRSQPLPAATASPPSAFPALIQVHTRPPSPPHSPPNSSASHPSGFAVGENPAASTAARPWDQGR